jgi:hypothetical protein
MRLLFVSLLVAPMALGQGRAASTVGQAFVVRVHPVPSTKHVSMRISIDGQLMTTLGVETPCTGELRLEGHTGTATCSLLGEIGSKPGELTFVSDSPEVELELTVTPRDGAQVPTYSARGRSVRVARSATGVLTAQPIP